MESLQALLLGGIVGAMGQAARVLIGLKKEWDAADRDGATLVRRIVLPRIAVSLSVGFIAGAVAAVVLGAGAQDAPDGAHQLLALFMTGYAGTDFVEGVVRRRAP